MPVLGQQWTGRLSVPRLEFLIGLAQRTARIEGIGPPAVVGTGFAIAPSFALGCDAGGPEVALRFGYVRPGTEGEPRRATRVATPAQLGLYRLDEPFDEPLRLAPESYNEHLFEGAELWLAGSQRGGVVEVAAGALVALEADRLWHRINTSPGTTGAPIVDASERVVAVHFGRSERGGEGSSAPEGSNHALRIGALLEALRAENAALYDEVLEAAGITSPARARAQVEAYRSRRAAASTTRPGDGFRRGAAVLWEFDPASLRPFPSDPDAGSAWGHLWSEAVVRSAPDEETRWWLPADVREAALAELGSLEVMRAARAANPGVVAAEGEPQWLLDRVLAEAELELDALPAAALDALIGIARWLRPFVASLPSDAELTERQSRAHQLQPLRELAEGLLDRTLELRAMASWLGAEAAPAPPRAALVVTGPGGTGKSALIAQFILDRQGTALAFVYLDFDRPGLSASDSLGLASEVLRQLTSLWPLSDAARLEADAVLGRSRQHLGAAEHEVTRSQSASERAQTRASMTSLRTTLLDEVTATIAASLRARGDATDPPLLVVLDSYEEIQPAPHLAPPGVEAMLIALQGAYPAVRVLIAGRSDVAAPALEGEAVAPIQVGGLDDEHGRQLLERFGVTRPDDVALLLRLTRGNPLALKLGAEVVGREGSRPLLEDEALRQRLSDTLVQGMLYRRLLDHVAGTDSLRALVQAALVLRRVTAETIERVLAPALGHGEVDATRARELFEALANVGSLVRREGDVLVHRPDVRRTVVELLALEDRDQVGRIDAAALDYYAGLETPASWQRGERLYHALRLGLDGGTLDQLWNAAPDLGASFSAGDADDLPTESASWLLGRVGGVTLETLWAHEPTVADSARLLARGLSDALRGDVTGEIERYLGRVEEAVARQGDLAANPELAYLRALGALRLGRAEAALTATEAIAEAPPDLWLLRSLHLVRAEAYELLGELERCVAEIDALGTELEPFFESAVLAQKVVAVRRPLGSYEGAVPPGLVEQVLSTALARLLRLVYELRIGPVTKGGYAVREGEDLALGRYVACAASLSEVELMTLPLRRFGLPHWTAEDVQAVLEAHPDATERFGWFVSEGIRLLQMATDKLEGPALHAILTRLPEATHDLAPWLAKSFERDPSLVEVFVALYERVLRGTIYRRLRGYRVGGEEMIES